MYHKIEMWLCAAFVAMGACVSAADYDVAAYVWPAYQPEPRWVELGIFKDGKGEWQNVWEAVPKWEGHNQPLVPLWGYENEADPKVVERKIDAAASHGVNVFIYDWYWYGGRPFLEDALDKGFLGAANNGKMKFFIMYANHHVCKLWDNKAADKDWSHPIWRAWVDEEEFRKISRRWIERYFSRPNYYRIDGKPVLMIYEVVTFLRGVGGMEKAAKALATFRKDCEGAGFGGVHIMACDYNLPKEVVAALGIDSATIYNFVHWASAKGNPDYDEWTKCGAKRFDAAKKELGLKAYFAHASVGWDTNPRFPADAVMPTVMNSTPAKFEAALKRAKDWSDANTPKGYPKLITVNSWNEWTEGSYLEPNTKLGFGYLEAVKNVFGPRGNPVLVPAPRQMKLTGGNCEVRAKDVGDLSIKETVDASLPPEGYRLAVTKEGVSVASADAAGAFYARQTLAQLLDDCRGSKSAASVSLPCLEIEDAPAYRWRGVHFDDCRHFFGKQTLKKTLDLMARHKMNVLHWHLTEDQGWRLEIPGYPDLIKYGAVRPSSPSHGARSRKDKNGKSHIDMDGLRYGPFYYTEADIKEIISYAAERHITIVPEIELPGHVCAALAAYPELTCKPENMAHRHPRVVWGIEHEVLCLGNDKAIKFMEDVLDYVCRLFPGPFVHIGGDECPTDRWKTCSKCQARIEKEGLGDEKGLQPWVTRHFVKFLAARGKRTIGWDEYLNGDVPKDAVGMSWRTSQHNGARQNLVTGAAGAQRGHDMVMTPHDMTYFYYGQGLEDDPFQYGDSGARVFGGGRLPLEKVYSFDPRAGIPPELQARILGGQCCNWSEYTWNEYDLEWKMWPRTCAMAETLWTGDRKPGFADFKCRMVRHRRQLISAGVNCAPLQ